jgi:hypothetical protein
VSLEHSPTRQQQGAVAFDTIPARAGYTVPEFCAAHRISRSKLYDLWARKIGPRRMEVDGKVIITVEGAADWRREMEERTQAEAGEVA